MSRTKGAVDRSIRLPPISAGLVIEITFLEVLRELHGRAWCEAEGVGAIRVKLGKVPELRRELQDAEMDAVDKARDGARVLLKRVCDKCPLDCPLKAY